MNLDLRTLISLKWMLYIRIRTAEDVMGRCS